jgi:hypothetical protein
MARMIFFCSKCNSTYGADSGTHNSCPDCKIPLIETSITSDYWRTLSASQKEQERLSLAQRAQDAQDQMRQRQEALAREEKEKQYHLRITRLKSQGFDGYYEYKVISMLDVGGLFQSNSGRVNTEAMTQTLNDLGIDGWHLVTAYSNELGKNALSGGAGAMLLGVNSTVDENVLIFERFVKI